MLCGVKAILAKNRPTEADWLIFLNYGIKYHEGMILHCNEVHIFVVTFWREI
jgi:hypothetical protein